MNTISSIYIPSGTIISELRNGADGNVQERHIALLCDVIVEASRHDDGCYGYSVPGLPHRVFSASAGTVVVLHK